MMRRAYSDADKATVLALLDLNGGNVARTARTVRIPRKTLADWSKGRKINGHVAELRHQKKKELAELLEEFAFQLLEAVPEKIPDASLLDAMRSLGIAIDKVLLLRGCRCGAARAA